MGVKIFTTVENDITKKIEEWVKLKQQMDTKSQELQAKVTALQDEFNKQNAEALKQITDLTPEITDFIKKLPVTMVEVDNLIVEYKKSSRTTYSYQTLFQAALERVNEEVKKELLNIQETVKKVSVTENLVIKAKESLEEGWLGDIVNKVKGLYSEIKNSFKSFFSRMSGAVNNMKSVINKMKSVKEDVEQISDTANKVKDSDNPRETILTSLFVVKDKEE